VTVGGREVQLLEVGPTHTRGDILVYVPDAGTLYAGDILFVEVTPVLWAGPLERWIAALEKILQMEVNCIVPGHGPIIDKAGVQLLRDYWIFLDRQVRERHKAGMSAQEAAYEIARSPAFTNSIFALWDSPERMLVNVYTLYRWLEGRTTPPKLLERLRIFAQEAEFAGNFPTASPACLHRVPVDQRCCRKSMKSPSEILHTARSAINSR
jgi:cyclase